VLILVTRCSACYITQCFSAPLGTRITRKGLSYITSGAPLGHSVFTSPAYHLVIPISAELLARQASYQLPMVARSAHPFEILALLGYAAVSVGHIIGSM
jgi:hypothetical protein